MSMVVLVGVLRIISSTEMSSFWRETHTFIPCLTSMERKKINDFNPSQAKKYTCSINLIDFQVRFEVGNSDKIIFSFNF